MILYNEYILQMQIKVNKMARVFFYEADKKAGDDDGL
jgi:hypothetical protein